MTANRPCCDIANLEERLVALLALAHEAESRDSLMFPATIIALLDPQHDATHGGTSAKDLLDPDEGEAVA